MRSEADFLQDMLDSALRLQREIAGKDYAQFLSDETLQDAVVLRLAVIGEDVLSHVYWRINYQIVWDTATRDVPEVIRHISAHLGRSGGTGTGP